MRKEFEAQLQLDSIPIGEVEIDMRSRHELPQLLAGLQHIFTNEALRTAVLKVLSEAILSEKKATGRLGMSLWELFVLGCCRLNLNIDYDNLHDLSNNHHSLRGILGVATRGYLPNVKHYCLQTIKDNVGLLTEDNLNEINKIIVNEGHQLKKKEGKILELNLKADSFVVERHIHFPTDIRLLWDCVHKCIGFIKLLKSVVDISGLRNYKSIRKKIKRLYTLTARIHKRKGNNYIKRLQDSTEEYLAATYPLLKKVNDLVEALSEIIDSKPHLATKLESLKYYRDMLKKHIDLVDRRILQGEQIPHSEKVFSIFEPETEWLKKGKAHPNVELGHNVLIVTDQFHFIVYHKVAVKEQDKDLVIPLGKELQERFKEKCKLYSISFDKGFWLKSNKEAMEKIFDIVVMPKKGKPTIAEKEAYHRQITTKLISVNIVQ
ncbi:MAG: ISNCY family transposase [Chitinophagales bacterium]